MYSVCEKDTSRLSVLSVCVLMYACCDVYPTAHSCQLVIKNKKDVSRVDVYTKGHMVCVHVFNFREQKKSCLTVCTFPHECLSIRARGV